MTTNDILTLTISSAAFLVSLGAAVLGTLQGQRNMKITVRDQLTEIVQKLIETMEEMNNPPDVANDPTLTDQQASSLNHRLTSLTRQAMNLDKLDSRVAFDVEYIAIANALVSSGNTLEAEKYHIKAVKNSQGFYKALNLRLYGIYLHNRGRYALSRKKFLESIAVLDSGTEDDQIQNAQTYEDWLGAEIHNLPPPNEYVYSCYMNAERLYSSVTLAPLRDNLVNRFKQRWNSLRLDDYTEKSVPNVIAPTVGTGSGR